MDLTRGLVSSQWRRLDTICITSDIFPYSFFFFFIRFGLPFIVRVLRELSYENLQAAILKAMSRILLDNVSSQVRVIQLLRGKFLWSEKSAVMSINPFAPGDFAEKRVLKLDEWFSGHCRAIKS